MPHTVAVIGPDDDPPDTETMPTSERIREILVHYVARLIAGDVDALAALYTEDGRVEDAPGRQRARRHRCGSRVLRWYGRHAARRDRRADLLRSAYRRDAASRAPHLARPTPPRDRDAIDVVEFDSDERIRSLRAYWNPAAMRDTPEVV